MRNFLLASILLFTISSFTIPGQYERDIFDAVNLLKKENQTIEHVAANYDCDRLEVLSIVFPEVIRYSRFKDFFETKLLEQLYLLKGAAWADFSIGFFQMKPSFVEDLEYHVKYLSSIKNQFAEIISYEEIGEESIRKERINPKD